MSTLGPTGLTIDSITDLVAQLIVALQAIYGSDINTNSNSPDGQLINSFCQVVQDTLELLQAIYNSFGYATAVGTQLDQRLAILGVARRQGTYTTTPVLVVASQALTLYGLDQSAQPVYMVSDQAGNQYNLQTTAVFSGSGSQTLTFQAVQIGQVQVTANTITNQVTTVLGITSVNNPSTSGVVTGVPEENDTQFKIRAGQSFALASTGPADAVEAALLAIPDATDAYVVENATNAIVNDVDPHTIWCIVTGGTDAEIAQAIYAKKGIGCGMKGSVSYVIARPNGTSFTAQWDVSITQPLYVKATINPRTPGQSFDTSLLESQLAAALVYKLSDSPTIGDVVNAMLVLAPTAYLTDIGVSTDGISYFDVVTPTGPPYYFTVSEDNVVISQ